jgi:hypothetical protein
MKYLMLTLAGLLGLGLLAACGEKDSSFSLLQDSNTFYQNGTNLNSKMDMLWIIDNSGSMDSSQKNLKDNFKSFIADFITKGYDFRIAVIDTGAWQSQFSNTKTYSLFRDGTGSTHSKVFVINPTTPNIIDTFATNVLLGTAGTGDERMHSSFIQGLINTQNPAFVRANAHLAIINLTDEDDFSHDNAQSIGHDYNHPSLIPVSNYVTWLDNFTQSSGATRRYSVHTVSIQDQTCLNALNAQSSGRLISTRVNQLVDLTGGKKVSLCGDFASGLKTMAQEIIKASTRFVLDREPIPETIQVFVNDVLAVQSPTDGWSYEAASMTIVFNGNSAPVQGSKIYVKFDPKTIE